MNGSISDRNRRALDSSISRVRATPRRDGLAGTLASLDDVVGGSGGWWGIAEPDIELLDDTPELVPDVARWRRHRMPDLPLDEPIRMGARLALRDHGVLEARA